ncbi:DNA methyltransferase [Candidatus Poriferisodalis sp.]|uniref:DNA methyltransferase n=1 Tax=Candidatus Poriferisodalis sp. TaxID=3101277 RepID=UPI003B0280AB
MVDRSQRGAARSVAQARFPMTTDIRGSKGSVFYRAHSYHTKVPVESIVQLIEHYTDVGDVVVDPFCGSGQTGVAAMLTGRHAVVSDLSPAAVHIARGYTARVDPVRFAKAASRLLNRLAPVERELYGVSDGRIEYTVWSDVFRCATCARDILFWEAAVDHRAGQVTRSLSCPAGHGPFNKSDLDWVGSRPVQQNTSVDGQRARVVEPARTSRDITTLDRSSIPFWFPVEPWERWREMWRAQHDAQGIDTSADFFTNRNLYALAALWDAIEQVDDETTRVGLRFVFTASVNRASRRYQWHPSRPTNVLSSTMYLASLNYEFNVFSLFRRKLSTITQMYEQLWQACGSCEVHQGSAESLDWLADGAADYVFTDPPFGSNIFYGDSSFLWEAWLGDRTDVAAETVINKRLTDELGRTTLDGYEKAVSRAMEEIGRVLRPGAWASLQFHNSDDAVWSAIQNAVDSAGLSVQAAVVMDKGQASFKGLRHHQKGEKVANFDLVLHLASGSQLGMRPPRREIGRTDIQRVLEAYVAHQPPSRCTTPWLHSQAMRHLIASSASPAGWSFAAVEALCDETFERRGNSWRPRTKTA